MSGRIIESTSSRLGKNGEYFVLQVIVVVPIAGGEVTLLRDLYLMLMRLAEDFIFSGHRGVKMLECSQQCVFVCTQTP